MTNAMSYPACVEYDDEDCILAGHLTDINDGVSFHADTMGSYARRFTRR